ncbi:heterotrimeric G-protein alpha subunit, GPA3-like protein [Infundibulicybe gibba]|nr:heterotrimeric G-protein alpha subunit, GPA3-like protein [Infundibulicybe gibba]
MGNYISTLDAKRRAAQAKARSDAIDKQIEEDNKKYKREHKILVLGSGESGKSTLIKQMKINLEGGFSNAELADFRPIIYQNLLDSMQSVILCMRKIGLECIDDKNRVLAEKVLDYSLKPSGDSSFSPKIAGAIHQLWKDPTILEVISEHSGDFYLMDSAGYFFDEALRIGTPGYLPNKTDVLKAHQKSQGITETRFAMGQLLIRMFDVSGQRSERRKWIHFFKGVGSIIFCVALSEYDQVLLEERSQNRMLESLVLFEAVVNSRWFVRTSIVLFLNKTDIFKDKLPTVPLERYFPEYPGGTDTNKAAKYILWQFMQTNRARLSLHPHITQATDTRNIRLVFAAVKEIILQNALKDSGAL